MKQKTKHNLITLLGLAVIGSIVVMINQSPWRGSDTEISIEARRLAEKARKDAGMEIIDWNLLLKTKGSFSGLPQFSEALEAKNNTEVNAIGYMIPENQFEAMNEFVLLPYEVDCLFCNRVQARELIVVRMEEGTTAELLKGPALVSGVLQLHQGGESRLYYSLENATLTPAEEGATPKLRTLDPEHTTPTHADEVKELRDENPAPGEKDAV